MWAVHPSNTSDTSLQKCLLAASPREDRRGTTSATIVRGEDDDGVVVESVRLQSLHHSAHPSVQSLCFVFAKSKQYPKKKLVNKNCCSDRSSCVCGSHCSITAVCTVQLRAFLVSFCQSVPPEFLRSFLRMFSHCDGGSPIDSLGVLMKISLVNPCPSLILVQVDCRRLLKINR